MDDRMTTRTSPRPALALVHHEPAHGGEAHRNAHFLGCGDIGQRRHPLIGERVYIRDFVNDERIVLAAPRLLLHAHTLGFEHPVTGAQVACKSPLPDDFVSALTRLGWSGAYAD